MTTAGYSNATTVGQQKLNVVTRLAIEGKSKSDWDGASIKMYLKVSRPLLCTRRRMLYAFPAGKSHSADGTQVPQQYHLNPCLLCGCFPSNVRVVVAE